MQKATSVQRCLNSKYTLVLHTLVSIITARISALGPGSTNLLAKLTERNPRKSFNTTKKGPRDLNIREWGILLEEFKNWPFRPQVQLPSFHIDRGILIIVLRTSGLSHSSRVVFVFARTDGTQGYNSY